VALTPAGARQVPPRLRAPDGRGGQPTPCSATASATAASSRSRPGSCPGSSPASYPSTHPSRRGSMRGVRNRYIVTYDITDIDGGTSCSRRCARLRRPSPVLGVPRRPSRPRALSNMTCRRPRDGRPRRGPDTSSSIWARPTAARPGCISPWNVAYRTPSAPRDPVGWRRGPAPSTRSVATE